MRLSVCIVNWNTRDDLRECLAALHAHPFTGGEQEIVVVDNASADGSAAMVAAEFPAVRLIANARNRNFAEGTNQALESGRRSQVAGRSEGNSDCFLLVNPDAKVTEGALDTLVGTQSEVSSSSLRPATCDLRPVGAVAARLVYENGETQRSVRGFPAPLAVLYDIVGLGRVFPRSPVFGAYRMTYFDYEKAQLAPQPMASCFLITREAYEKVGGMDERFPLYFNDVDWCLRCYEAGFGIWYEPKAVVVHGGGGTTKKARKATIWESHRALLRLWAKHYKRKTPRLLYALVTNLVTVGAWARTGRWGESLGKDGGETTPESLHTELEREKRPAGVPPQP